MAVLQCSAQSCSSEDVWKSISDGLKETVTLFLLKVHDEKNYRFPPPNTLLWRKYRNNVFSKNSADIFLKMQMFYCTSHSGIRIYILFNVKSVIRF